ncbi:MAG: hypothetical protein R3D59_09915 [Paracoccaceae bacterium]
MTDITPASTDQQKIEGSSARRAGITGGILIALALLVVASCSTSAPAPYWRRSSSPPPATRSRSAIWKWCPGRSAPSPRRSSPSSACASSLRGGGKWSSLSIGIGLALVIMAFLVWATAGKSFNLTGMLQATMVRAIPIALGELAGVLSERVAVVNIAIEGMLLARGLLGALVGSVLGNWLGIVGAVVITAGCSG